MELSTVGQIVGHIVTFLAAFVAARASIGAKRVDAQASPYDKIAARVTHLEDEVVELRRKIETLESERSDLRDLVTRMWRYIEVHVPSTIARPFARPHWMRPESQQSPSLDY